ncbi:hypothetical protein [Aquibacillus rhizosphaerae]|uniref:Spore coat protein n=1 Tax=Aquibacillus rhizosphaerae TaxID=3051431 RepID=A0ABT7L7M3_9BACI|nr:hypothetical protein [Aquibacillus sp. LR5S19]MDL4841861.1 hypothetical protein [Aquibacillus sp. LR5S19]
MQLPAIDVGLMKEHLTAHEGIIYDISNDYSKVRHTFLKALIEKQIIVMTDHVRVMLKLLEPERENWVSLATSNPNISIESLQNSAANQDEKPIVAGLMTTSMLMANDNYNSALRMSNENVKHVHYIMAMQQASFQNYYTIFMEQMGWSITPKANLEDQKQVIQHFRHLIK